MFCTLICLNVSYDNWLLHVLVQKEDKQSCWNLLTFNSVTSVMDDGAKKQLNFEDLLQLPNEMDPSFCHNKLSFCWKDQCSRNCLNPSFFWAICCAYGWSYVSLGLLKVFPYLKSAMFSHLIDSKEKKKKTESKNFIFQGFHFTEM